ncbi:MAG: ABC transporter substrate-binding protein [Reyranellaceae bacterium]
MRRRALVLSMLGTAGAAGARAQALPRIGYLSGRSQATDAHLLAAFLEGLKAGGFVDGETVKVEVRWADGRYDEVPKLAEAVVQTQPNILVAVGGNPVSLAAKQATQRIPVLFGAGADPVQIGLVANLNRPEANLTGMTLYAQDLDAKRLEMLHDMLPSARRIALLLNPQNPAADAEMAYTRQAADALRLQLDVVNASRSGEIERGFAGLAPGTVDALAVAADAFLINRRARILELAAERRLPGMFPNREFVLDGGLASYGARWSDMYRLLGTYAARMLKGARPAELPVQRPTTFELVLNLKTARTLGLALSPLVLNRADEVLE